MTDKPVVFIWTGEVMNPLPRFAADCERQFTVGHRYRLGEIETASLKSRGHFFASLHEAWQNMPEALLGRFPTSEHLRKWALIQRGFCHERMFVADSAEEARRLVAFIAPLDQYAVIIVKGEVVKVLTAESQAESSMKKQRFQASKDAVLEEAWALCGLTPQEADPHVGRAA